MKNEVKFEIPKNARPLTCRAEACRAKIYLVPSGKLNGNGSPRLMPVNEDGSPHWATCAEAARFRKPKPKQGDLFGGAHE